MLYTGTVVKRESAATLSRKSKATISLRKRDAIELIKADLPEYTSAPFFVEITSDDGGALIQITVEDHKNAPKILDDFSSQYKSHRLVVLKVPEGYIEGMKNE